MMTLMLGVQGNMMRLQKYKAIGYMMVLLNVLWVVPYVGAVERSQTPPGYRSVISATVKNRSAAVRTGPSEKASLIGYVPGATRINMFPYSDKNGWVQVEIDWKSKATSWIKRSDVAIARDYKPYAGQWPLDYVLFRADSNEMPISHAWVFPPDNLCGTDKAKAMQYSVAKKIQIPLRRVYCQELWEVPGTSLIYPNPDGQTVDIWFERKSQKIFMNSSFSFGLIIGELVYGYRNGKNFSIVTECTSGKSIACRISSETAPSKSPEMSDPKQNRKSGP